jgi:hypothetical protein
MVKWLAASLVAVNGAGSVEAANLSIAQNGGGRLAGAAFTAGIALAFLSAAAAHQIVGRMQGPALEMSYFQTHADFTGEYDRGREAVLEGQLKRAARFHFVPPLLAAASALLFAAGAMLLAFV